MAISRVGGSPRIVSGCTPGDLNASLYRYVIGHASWEEVEAAVRGAAIPRHLVFNLNHSCNLACSHCFFTVDRLSRPLLSESKLMGLIEEACSLPSLTTLSLAGKEPFLSPGRLRLVLRMLARRSGLQVGITTNGTLLKKHLAIFDETGVDYLDISIDGPRDVHDRLRGPGHYEESLEAVDIAHSAGIARKVFVNCTVTALNYHRVVPFLRDMIGRGCRYFSLSLFIPTPSNDHSLGLDPAAFRTFVDSLLSWSAIPTDHPPVEIYVTFNSFVLAYLRLAMQAGLIHLEDAEVNPAGDLFVRAHTNGPAQVVFEIDMPWDTMTKYGRITADGYYLPGCEALTVQDYAAHAEADLLERPLSAIPEIIASSASLRRTLDLIADKLSTSSDRTAMFWSPYYSACILGTLDAHDYVEDSASFH